MGNFFRFSLSLLYTKTYADTPTWDCPSLQAKTLYKHIPYCTHAADDFHFKSVNTKFSDPKSTIFLTQEKNNDSLFCISIPFLVTTQKKRFRSSKLHSNFLPFHFLNPTLFVSLFYIWVHMGSFWSLLCFFLLSLVNKKKEEGIFEKIKKKKKIWASLRTVILLHADPFYCFLSCSHFYYILGFWWCNAMILFCIICFFGFIVTKKGNFFFSFIQLF